MAVSTCQRRRCANRRRKLFAADDVEQMLQQGLDALDADAVGPAAGEIGLGAFEPPGSRAPVGGGGFAESAEGMELGLELGLAEELAKLAVLLGFAGDGTVGAADVAGGAAEAAAGGYEGANFAALDIVESAGTTGLGHGFVPCRRADGERGRRTWLATRYDICVHYRPFEPSGGAGSISTEKFGQGRDSGKRRHPLAGIEEA